MRKLVFLFLALLLSAPVYAEPPSDASIDELLKLTKAEETLDQMKSMVTNAQLTLMDSALAEYAHVPEDQKNKLYAIVVKFMLGISDSLAWHEIRPTYIKVFRDNFSQKEVDDQIAFYKTPTGQSVVNKLPNAMRATMQAQQAKTQPILEEFQKSFKQWQEQYANTGDASKNQPNSPTPPAPAP